MRRSDVPAVLPAVALVALVAAGCRSRPTPAECAAMIDKYVEMTAARDPSLAGVAEPQASELRRAMIDAKKKEPAYAAAIDRCRDETSRAEYECAMKTDAPNDWEACIE